MSATLAIRGVPAPVDRLTPNSQYDVKAELCGTCRFWLPDQRTLAPGEMLRPDDLDFGLCRRRPPVVIEAMVVRHMTPASYREQIDPEDAFDTSDLFHSSHQPGTFVTEWCGEFERLPETGGQS